MNGSNKAVVKIPTAPKVSKTFAESMPMYANIIEMYGNSFKNVNKN